MTMSAIETCDLCNSTELKAVYPVPGTARGLVVNVCKNCGLAQSLPRIDHVDRRSAFPDSGAGFGNIRYGKGFRTEFALKVIDEIRPLALFERCLDVGANRGSFVLALHGRAPNIAIDAVEPDERVAGDYEHHEQINLIRQRIEHVDLAASTYDLVYHCHTLEHEAHPTSSLRAIHKAMTDDGLLFLEVPNIALLQREDLVEEWFIDKHLYHFSASSLLLMLKAVGFEVVRAPDEEDETNLTVVLRKGEPQVMDVEKSVAPKEIARIGAYANSLHQNQQRLQEGSTRLAEYCDSHAVVIWGAGRIFTSLVDVGGFDPTVLAGLVDRNLLKYVKEMYGVEISEPQAIAEIRPHTVLVASRLYLDEIRRELAAITTDVTVLTLDDVLAGTIGDENGR